MAISETYACYEPCDSFLIESDDESMDLAEVVASALRLINDFEDPVTPGTIILMYIYYYYGPSAHGVVDSERH